MALDLGESWLSPCISCVSSDMILAFIFLTYSVLVARASFVSLLLVAAAVSWWAEEVPEWISQNNCRFLFQHWMYSRFRKYSEHFAFCTLYYVVDLVLNWWNLQFMPINLHLVSHNDKFLLANLLKAEFLIYKSIKTLLCGTPNWGQVHPVCFKCASDVSRMWLESIRANLICHIKLIVHNLKKSQYLALHLTRKPMLIQENLRKGL